MKDTRILMGMPVTVEIADIGDHRWAIELAYAYFEYVDATFSTYKETSEISRINRKELSADKLSDDMKTVFWLSEETRKLSGGYFNIRRPDGSIDPSGLVKGWAIRNAVRLLENEGFQHFYIDAGGDIQTSGLNADGEPWRVGIRNPFETEQIVKIVPLSGKGMATSGTYIRGRHIWNPHQSDEIPDIVSLTVVGPDIYEADRFATAAFAMGRSGINFIERLRDFEGYMIDEKGIATMTSGFQALTLPSYALAGR